MVKFINRCKMPVASGGAGTITFGANAVAGFESLADQSVGAGDELRYTLEQNNEYEVGTGIIGLSGGTYTMTRTPLRSSNSDNSAISAGAAAVCFFTMLADDVAQYLADLANVSDTSPSAGQALTWDAVASAWKPASPSGGITNVSTYANLPGSPSVTDLAFVTDQKSLYIYDGTEWDRVFTGSQIAPRFTTLPASSLELNSDGTTSNLTAVAVDDAAFPISYDWDAFSGTTLYNASSLPPQLTAVAESSGVFTLTPTTNSSNAGSFQFRIKASDGVLAISETTSMSLTFFPQASNLIGRWDIGDSNSYSGSGTTWTDISGNGNTLTIGAGGAYNTTSGGGSDAGYGFAASSTSIPFGSMLDNAKTVAVILSDLGGSIVLFTDGGTFDWNGNVRNGSGTWGSHQEGNYPSYGSPAWPGETPSFLVNGNSVTTRQASWNNVESSKFNSLVFRGIDMNTNTSYNGYTTSTWHNYQNTHNLRSIIAWDVVLTDAEVKIVHQYYPSMATWDGV